MDNVIRYCNILLLIALPAIFAATSLEARESQEEILVGRISYVEGKLLRFIEEEKDWVDTVKDAPFGLEDALYSGENAKAEFIMPNRTWLRVGENTQMQLLALDYDATTVDVGSGLARLYNKSEDTIIKATTPFGYIVAPGGTVVDLYVGDDSIEVIAVVGDVDFIHDASAARYTVQEGSSSIIADNREVAQGNGAVDSDWDNWNEERDNVWAQRERRGRNSAGFLPEPIREESAILEENGEWERVDYEGTYRDMWRPTRVDRDWRPFTAGRWTVYYGDNCWIPDEPFGYVTHHYGSWVYIESSGAWYWIPPGGRFVVATPGISMRFGWYPGRVGWIHSGRSIGWVPLAPGEPYYGHRPWGHTTLIVNNHSLGDINRNVARYRFLGEAVIIQSDDLYRGRSYAPFMQGKFDRNAILNHYKPTAVINTSVISNFDNDRRRFTSSDVEVTHKPHKVVVKRINDNQNAIRGFGGMHRERIERDLKRFNAVSEPPMRSEMHRPMLTTKIVAAENIGKPINSLSFERKEMKPKEREREILIDNAPRSRLPERGGLGRSDNFADQEKRVRTRSSRDRQGEVLQEQQIRQPSEEHMQRKKQEELQREGSAPPQIEEPRRRRLSGDEVKQEKQQQQQDEFRHRQEQELQHRQQLENQRRQEREMQTKELEQQRRQQVEQQRHQDLEIQRQQQEEQKVRLKQERLQQQQGDVQRRQELEMRGRQQEGQQMRQKQLKPHESPEAVQQQEQALKKKKKHQQEEELQLEQRPPAK